jgi:DNA-binding NtrC family response regulator
MPTHILIVEDEVNMARTLAKILRRRGFTVDVAGNGHEALAAMGGADFDVVVTDLNMPGMDGMTLLSKMKERELSPVTLVLTGHGTIQSAVEAMRLGAWDYLIKPCHPDDLLLKVQQALETRDLRRQVNRLQTELRHHTRFGEIIGQTESMQKIYATIEAVSQNKSNILISGENGTGKELVARAIHAKSALAKEPFVAINCGALAETLLESQLFGHRKGAFTGAIEDHEGVFQAAHGGTLFLDEIAEIPPSLQVKFLRAIQEKEVTPLGTTRPTKVDARLIAATNVDLDERMRTGRFRADLYYRLNVVSIVMPSLRQRREDIPLLVEHFVAEFSQSYGVEPKRVSPAAMERLTRYDWPGNVRELQNAIERAFALSNAPEIRLEDLPPAVLEKSPGTSAADASPEDPRAEPLPLEDLEKVNIANALRRSGGNKNEAARILGIDRQRLYRKIEKYGLE